MLQWSLWCGNRSVWSGAGGANQSALTLGNNDGEIAGLTIPPDRRDPPTEAEPQPLRSNREPLPSYVRALSALGHALRGAVGVVRGGA